MAKTALRLTATNVAEAFESAIKDVKKAIPSSSLVEAKPDFAGYLILLIQLDAHDKMFLNSLLLVKHPYLLLWKCITVAFKRSSTMAK